MWTHLDAEIRADPDFQVALDELRNFSDRGCRDQDAVQTNVDNMLERITRSLYNSFGAHKLIAKRSFSFHQGNPANANYGAPEQLRALRREESRAKAEYLATRRTSGDDDQAVTATKHRWNVANAQCRKAAKSVKAGFCTDWRHLWNSMLWNKPRQLWNTLRQFTAQRNVEITCTLEKQLEHWTSQGEVEEAVWTNDERLQSEQWVEWLRSLPISSNPVIPTEASSSRQRLRHARGGWNCSRGAEELTLPVRSCNPSLLRFDALRHLSDQLGHSNSSILAEARKTTKSNFKPPWNPPFKQLRCLVRAGTG